MLVFASDEGLTHLARPDIHEPLGQPPSKRVKKTTKDLQEILI